MSSYQSFFGGLWSSFAAVALSPVSRSSWKKSKNRSLFLSTAHFTHFDTIIQVQGMSVRMTEPPENVVFNS
jgi:hypothetical protein